ncbi:hypothetical protein pb186bvf_003639 [Paramecium bursaria]
MIHKQMVYILKTQAYQNESSYVFFNKLKIILNQSQRKTLQFKESKFQQFFEIQTSIISIPQYICY